MILLKGGSVLSGEGLVKQDVLVQDGLIAKLGDSLSFSDCDVIDVSGCWVIPGTIDIHAHFREPGFTEKGTVYTESRSAAKGGVTTAFAMPNLSPSPDSAVNLAVEEEAIKRDGVIRIYPYGCVSVGEKGERAADYDSLSGRVIGLSDDGVGVNNIEVLKEAMRWAKRHDTIIASHAEYEGKGTSPEAEYLAVEREIALVSEIGCKYHFCHISTSRAFKAIKTAQLNGVDVSCEVTPHHLLLCDEDINGNTDFKMNPPLRSRADMEATVRALLDGTAQIVASDHAPHSAADKRKSYDKAPNGIIGFETTLPLLYTHFVRTGIISLRRFLELTVFNPTERFGLSRKDVSVGTVADLAVLDISNPHVYTKDEILSKGRNTPFSGRTLFGRNVLTLVGGKVVYKDTIFKDKGVRV